MRCEIQAIDQHWSLHRLAVALTDGQSDEHLAREITSLEISNTVETEIQWPRIEPDTWCQFLRRQLELELDPDVEAMRFRQQLTFNAR